MKKILTKNKLIEAYFDYRKSHSDSDYWAWEEVDVKLIKNDPDKAWQVILKLLEAAQDDGDLAYVAAGPLEDLLVYHGEKIIDRLEKEAQTNHKLRFTLSGVWRNKISEDIWKKILEWIRPEKLTLSEPYFGEGWEKRKVK